MSVIAAFDLGMGQVILILLVVLLLWGAWKLPRGSQTLAGLREGIRQFMQASREVAEELSNDRRMGEDEEQEAKFIGWVFLSLVVLVILIIGLAAIQR